MSDKQETIADIIAEMRERCIDEQHSPTLWPYFDRLEAAHKHELAASGNAAKLREALVEARKVIKAMGGYWARETLPIIDAALAEPPRNCDVGTPDEQVERWNNTNPYPYEWDDRQYLDAREVLGWAQMPYEETEGGAK